MYFLVFFLIMLVVAIVCISVVVANPGRPSSSGSDSPSTTNNLVAEAEEITAENRLEMAQKYCDPTSKGNSHEGIILPNGYWCIGKDFVPDPIYKRTSDYSIPSETVLDWIYAATKGKKIMELGAGCATYGQGLRIRAEKAGDAMPLYVGYEGALNAPEKFPGLLQWADLSKPLEAEQADWVFSFEVGEHIPSKFEDTFLDNIANHAKEGVIMSWAIVGQPGRGHINCRNPDWVVKKMTERGWVWDSEETKKLRAMPQARETGYFKNNLLLFRKKQ